MKQRVQKILAQAGVASRRKSEELIRQGKVLVNGRVVTIGESADPDTDTIVVNGRPVKLEKKVYIALHKPKGYVTTVSEQHGMKTTMQLVKVPQKVFPVGRLDKNTEGLLLLTNDGDFANRLMHPRYEVVKEYLVVVNKRALNLEKRLKNVVIDGRKVNVRGVRVKGREIVLRIHEGRKHIVRKMLAKLGLRVERLVRTRIGSLKLEGIRPGKWRLLTEKEVKQLAFSNHTKK